MALNLALHFTYLLYPYNNAMSMYYYLYLTDEETGAEKCQVTRLNYTANKEKWRDLAQIFLNAKSRPSVEGTMTGLKTASLDPFVTTIYFDDSFLLKEECCLLG